MVDYHGSFSTPGSGLFRLELDGVLQPGGIGSDTDVGIFWYLVHSQLANHGRRDYSLIFPHGANVDFLGMELTGATPGPLGPSPSRPPGVIVAYGDSITHGFKASSVAEGYPYLVGKLQQRSVINMGFVGQVLTPEDGTALGNLGGESVSLAIGTNDWAIDTTTSNFLLDYEALLDNIRAIQPSVPIFVITPTWVATEGVLNTIGLTREDYRQLIRDVVLPRTITDPELYLIEGSVLVPPGLDYFPDGVHPNDSGFAFFATALGGNNLVADPGFETEAYAWTDLGNSTCVNSDMQSGLKALQVGTGAGGRTQPVGRLQRAESYVMSAWSKVGTAGEIGTFGISFYDELGAELSKQTIQITSTTYQQDVFPVFTPAVFAYAEVWCKKDSGPSFVYVDDFELAEPGALAMQFLGDGRPGTLGVPSLGASTPTLASTTVTIDVGNSSGQPTGGALLF